jgi:hypothetical protein
MANRREFRAERIGLPIHLTIGIFPHGADINWLSQECHVIYRHAHTIHGHPVRVFLGTEWGSKKVCNLGFGYDLDLLRPLIFTHF